MIKYIVVSFFNKNNELVGKYKSVNGVADEKVELLMKEHNASHASIEYKARLTRELNIKIA